VEGGPPLNHELHQLHQPPIPFNKYRDAEKTIRLPQWLCMRLSPYWVISLHLSWWDPSSNGGTHFEKPIPTPIDVAGLQLGNLLSVTKSSFLSLKGKTACCSLCEFLEEAMTPTLQIIPPGGDTSKLIHKSQKGPYRGQGRY
jgi:hypothetical protein